MTDTKADLKARKKELELRQQELEIQKLEHELREAEADAEYAKDRTEIHRYDLEAERRREKRRKARDLVESHYDFEGVVNDGSVKHFSDWLLERRLVAPGKPVTLNIYSPGGSVFAGFVMMDAMREAREDGVEITAKISGMGASMAGIVAQAATTRLIGKDSWLMLHEIGTGMFGGFKLSDLADEQEFLRRLSRQCDKWYADRSGGKWTVEAIEKKVKKFDWWLSADEAVEAGFMDSTF